MVVPSLDTRSSSFIASSSSAARPVTAARTPFRIAVTSAPDTVTSGPPSETPFADTAPASEVMMFVAVDPNVCGAGGLDASNGGALAEYGHVNVRSALEPATLDEPE